MRVALDPELERITEKIIGAAFAVSRELGAGFLETVYRRAMAKSLRDEGLDVEEEAPFKVLFRGEAVGSYYADIVVHRAVIVETKTAEAISPAHVRQVLNYLRVSGLPVGLLFNFGPPRVAVRRILP